MSLHMSSSIACLFSFFLLSIRQVYICTFFFFFFFKLRNKGEFKKKAAKDTQYIAKYQIKEEEKKNKQILHILLLHYHLCLDTKLGVEPIPWYRARRALFPFKSHFIVTATYVRSNDPTHVQTIGGQLPLNVLLMQRVLGRTLAKLLLTVFFYIYNFSYRDEH